MQGYVVLACEHNRYRDMAINIARSLRVFDPHRSICLVHDTAIDITRECKSLFHDFAILDRDLRFVGVMNKSRLYDLSPYTQTMYLDADMLLLRPNISAYWDALNGRFFGMTGEKCVNGYWYGKDIAKIVADFRIPYVVKMNSGVFYFEKCSRAERLFSRTIDLFLNHKEELSRVHQNRTGQYADEPVFGLAMGEQGIDPLPTLEGHGSWMVTTWQTRRHVFDPERGVCYLQKSLGYPLRQQWLSRGWVHHSPNFVHFIQLEPRRHYDKAVAWFQERTQ